MQGSRRRHDFKYYHCTSTLFPLQFWCCPYDIVWPRWVICLWLFHLHLVPNVPFLAENFMLLEINPKRSSVRASSIMSVLSSDSGLVMPTVYEATWPSATKLWTYTEQRKIQILPTCFLLYFSPTAKKLTQVLEFHQMKIFRWARTWTLTSNRFFRCISTYWDINFVSKCLPAHCGL